MIFFGGELEPICDKYFGNIIFCHKVPTFGSKVCQKMKMCFQNYQN